MADEGKTTAWVVMVSEGGAPGDAYGVWLEVAVLEVPANTRSAQVLERAAEHSGVLQALVDGQRIRIYREADYVERVAHVERVPQVSFWTQEQHDQIQGALEGLNKDVEKAMFTGMPPASTLDEDAQPITMWSRTDLVQGAEPEA